MHLRPSKWHTLKLWQHSCMEFHLVADRRILSPCTLDQISSSLWVSVFFQIFCHLLWCPSGCSLGRLLPLSLSKIKEWIFFLLIRTNCMIQLLKYQKTTIKGETPFIELLKTLGLLVGPLFLGLILRYFFENISKKIARYLSPGKFSHPIQRYGPYYMAHIYGSEFGLKKYESQDSDWYFSGLFGDFGTLLGNIYKIYQYWNSHSEWNHLMCTLHTDCGYILLCYNLAIKNIIVRQWVLSRRKSMSTFCDSLWPLIILIWTLRLNKFQNFER